MIRRFAIAFIPLLLAAAPPETRDIGGAWKVEGKRVGLRAAGISLPDRAATLALTRTGEASRKGEALDNVAQFESPDGKVFGTIYIYRTTYADAALASSATRRAIIQRFGIAARIGDERAVPFAGNPAGAIRQIYEGTVLNGKAMATAAAFARIGGWLVKVRASGPADRASEVIAALDALIAGVAAGERSVVFAAAPLRVAAPCPAPDGPAPKLIRSKDSKAFTVIADLTGGSMMPDDTKGEPSSPSFPANGAQPVCVRGTIGNKDGPALIQPADGDLDVVLATTDDAGTVLAIERSLMGGGYIVKRYATGEVIVAGAIDRLPTAAQFERWLTTKGTPELAVRATVTVKADGATETSIAPSAFD